MAKCYSEDILRKAFEAGESYHAGKDFPYHGYKGKLPPDFDEWIKELREQSVDLKPEESPIQPVSSHLFPGDNRRPNDWSQKYDSPWVCDECGEKFDFEIDLLAHCFNSPCRNGC
jgi:hypothetical protein